MSPGEVTPLLMDQYRAHMLRTVKHNTAATQLRILRTIYRRVCRRLGEAPKDILENVDAVERYGAAPVQPTPAEVDRLQQWADTRGDDAARFVHMWLFSYYSSGIRWGDLCRLTVSQITGGRVIVPTQSKSDEPKNVKLRDKAARIAGLYRSGEYVFGIAGAKEPTPRQIQSANARANKWLKRAAKDCGITARLHTHSARHSYMARGRKAKVDDRTLQASMGIGDKAFKHYSGRFPQERVDEANDEIFGD